MLTKHDFRRRFLSLILLAWVLPPVMGLSFILFIRILTPEQMIGIMLAPIEPLYIILWVGFAAWYFPRCVQPVRRWLQHRDTKDAPLVLQSMRSFPLHFWGIFLVYLSLAPSSVMISAEMFTDFVAQPVDWFRIHLVALIVSIIVGLPIFFRILDLFGQSLGDLSLTRPHVTIKTKVFLIGALVPLLIDTMLVQYYWTRTGFFTMETFFVWLMLELLAIAGSLIFMQSIGQSMEPLRNMIEHGNTGTDTEQPSLQPMSTDELGVLATDYQKLLNELRIHNEFLTLNNRLLRSASQTDELPMLLDSIISLCQEAIGDDIAFLILRDEAGTDLLGVAQTGSSYNPEGHFRIGMHETSLAVWVFNEGKTVAIDATARDSRVSKRMNEHFGVKSAIASPLKADDTTIGVLMAVNCRQPHHYSQREITLIEGLAREAMLAISTTRLKTQRRMAEQALRRHHEELEQRVVERTRELESFSYSVSHDLRAPLRAINGYSRALLEDCHEKLDDENRNFLERISYNALHMAELIDDLLGLSRIGRAELKTEPVRPGEMAEKIMLTLQESRPQGRQVHFDNRVDTTVLADKRLLYVALENLLNNAWKYSGNEAVAEITFGTQAEGGKTIYYIRDNGVGFDMAYADKLFGAFQRLHRHNEFEGTGVGLATVARIIQRHGGSVWAEAETGKGATFYFTLGAPQKTGGLG